MSNTKTTICTANQPTKVTGEQESHRLREVQNLKKNLEGLLTEGETPNLNAQLLEDTLKKVEQMSSEAARDSNMDAETSKALGDLSELLTSARKLGKNKGIADRLQKIAEETAKALEASKRAGVSASTREKTEDMLNYIKNCRPLFQLLISSRDFRCLILDGIKIARRVIYSYGEDIKDEEKQKFKEGAPVEEMAQHLKERTQQKEVPEMNDEEWNKLEEDVQKVLGLMAREPQYKEGIERILSLLDMFQQTISSDDLKSNPLPNEKHFNSAVKETEALVSSFSGKDTWESFKSHLRKLLGDIQKNEKLHSYLSELKEFILKAKSEEEVRSEEFKSKSKDLAHRGRELMRELREKENLDPLFDTANQLIENIKNDELLSILRENAGVVQADLSYEDSEGKLHVDTDMLSKLKNVILPVITDAIKYIPLPKIESCNSERELVLDNMVLCGYDMMPDKICFHLESDTEVSIRDVEVKGSRTNLVITLKDLRTELKNVDFYYKKKTFPTIEDKGKVTFRFQGNGARLEFRYLVEQGPNDKLPQMKKGYASFDITNLSIEFDPNTLNHNILLPMFTQMYKLQIKHEIEREIEKSLTGFAEKLGNIMSENLGAMNRPFTSGLETAKKAVKSSQFAAVNEKRSEKLE